MRKIKTKILLGIGSIATVATATLPVLSVVSCGQPDIKAGTRTFEITQTLKTPNKLTSPDGKSGEKVNVYDATVNENAKELLQKAVDEITKNSLNYDFQNILTKFYKVYEFDSDKKEIEIENIRVIEKNPDGSFKLEVKYEVEQESSKKNTKDQETIKTATINKWTPRFTLISKDEISTIKEYISGSRVEQGNNNLQIDMSDLKEIFLGEKDADDPDDYGIFDFLEKTNMNYKNLAYLVSYELKLNDILTSIPEANQIPSKKATTITADTVFHVPSISFNKAAQIFIPSKTPELSVSKISKLNKSQMDDLFTKNTAEILNDKENKIKFNEVIGNFVDTNKEANTLTTIKSIKLEKQIDGINGDKYIIIVTYKNDKQNKDYFYVVPTDGKINAPVVTPTQK